MRSRIMVAVLASLTLGGVIGAQVNAGTPAREPVTIEQQLRHQLAIERTGHAREIRWLKQRAGNTWSSNRAIALALFERAGWGGEQWRCADRLITKESNYQERRFNRAGSGAYGIPQALPGSKMRSAGSTWRTNPAVQIDWMIGYIRSRYRTPCGAWDHSRASNWY